MWAARSTCSHERRGRRPPCRFTGACVMERCRYRHGPPPPWLTRRARSSHDQLFSGRSPSRDSGAVWQGGAGSRAWLPRAGRRRWHRTAGRGTGRCPSTAARLRTGPRGAGLLRPGGAGPWLTDRSRCPSQGGDRVHGAQVPEDTRQLAGLPAEVGALHLQRPGVVTRLQEQAQVLAQLPGTPQYDLLLHQRRAGPM